MDFTSEEKEAFLETPTKIDWSKIRINMRYMPYEEALERVRQIDERDRQKESPV